MGPKDNDIHQRPSADTATPVLGRRVKGDQSGRTQYLRAGIDNDLYSRVTEGSEIEVQYATADPQVILIGPEILNQSAT